MRKILLPLLLTALLSTLLALGCASDDETTDGDQPDGDTPDGDVPDGYPEGPYGYSQGDTIANFALVDSDGNTVNLADYYGEAKAVLINHSAGWCTVCREETPTLQQWYEELEADGVVIIQAMFETNSSAPADKAFAQAWKEQYELTYPVLVDANNILLDYHPTVQEGQATYGTPLNIILDRDFKIRYLLEGDVPHTLYDRLVELTEE